MAFSVFARSWPRHRPGTIAEKNRSPFWPWAPSSMFCSTVRRESALVSWKVRTTPSRATWCGPSLASDCPSKDQVPVLGWSKPVSRLNSVVLPAPFGPIRPVMPPRWISRWSTDTAVRPPKVRRTLSTTTAGSGLATPTSHGMSRSAAWAVRRGASPDFQAGSAPPGRSPVWSPGRYAEAPCAPGSEPAGGWVSAGIEHHLSSVAEDALRAEDQQQHQAHADDDEADLRHVGRRQEPLGDEPVVDQAAQQRVGELDDEQQQHRAHHRPEDARRAAEDQCRVGEERVGVLVLVGRRRGGADGVDHAAEGTEDGAHDEGLHLVDVDVLAERSDGVLVLADRLDDASPRTAHEQPDQQAGQRHQRPAHQHDPQLGAGPRRTEQPVAPAGVPRREGDEGAVEPREAPRAVGDRRR